jgi:hypothetical protein
MYEKRSIPSQVLEPPVNLQEQHIAVKDKSESEKRLTLLNYP